MNTVLWGTPINVQWHRVIMAMTLREPDNAYLATIELVRQARRLYIVNDFCPQCNRETMHTLLFDDEVFESAIQCRICNTIFEAVKESE